MARGSRKKISELTFQVATHLTEEAGKVLHDRAAEQGLKPAAYTRQLLMRGLGLIPTPED
jgi:hypothetical protein